MAAAVGVARQELVFGPVAVRRIRIEPVGDLGVVAGDDIQLAVGAEPDGVRAVLAAAVELLQQLDLVELVVAVGVAERDTGRCLGPCRR